MYHINRKETKPDIGYMEATIGRLMKKGIRLADCNKLKDYYSGLRDSIKSEIQTKYGIENPNSSKQVTDYLCYMSSRVNLESKNDIINICYDSEIDKWTSRAEAIEKLADLGYEFAEDLLDYRHVKKYAESIESVMKEMDENGLVHPKVSLGKTNRINYSEPGLLTIPKKLLWHIVAPYTPGNVLYSVDIKNQEPNILINMTGAEELKYALESPDGLYETLFKQCFAPKVTANVLIDTLPENRVYTNTELKKIGTISPALYSPKKPDINELYYEGKKITALETICVGSEKGLKPELPETVTIETEDFQLYNIKVTWDSVDKKYKRGNDYTVEGRLEGLDIKVSKAERKEFKTAWNALSYGASIYGIKMMCKTINGSTVYNYFTKLDALKNYRSRVDEAAKAGCNIIGTAFGTRLNAGYYDDYKKLKRVLLDLPIQGTGADILSLLVRRFYGYREEKGLTDKIELYYTRHDELIIEVNGEWLNEVGDTYIKDILKDMLEHQIDDWTPFSVEVKQAKADTSEIDLSDED